MFAPKRLEMSMGWLHHLLCLTVAVSCSEVDVNPVSSAQGGAAGRSGAAGTGLTPDTPDASLGGGGSAHPGGGSGGEGGGGGVRDAGPDADTTPEEPAPYWVDGGFATVECNGALAASDAGAVDAGDAGSSEPELADRDCDGLADSCSVDGDCASENLIVQYLFEQSLRDATPYGNDVTSFSDVRYEPGVVGDALVLGPNSVATLPRSASLELSDAVTVELWVQPSAMPPSGGRAGLLDDDGRYGLFLSPLGELRCVAGGATVSGGELTLDAWAHVACVLDASTVTLWQDGLVRAQVPRGGNLTTPGQYPLVIGGNSPSGDRFEGLLDNLRIWREARSPAQLSRAAQTRR